MTAIYSDLHIHIGRTASGGPVKITASPQLTLENILQTAAEKKGLQLIGLVDGACSGVREELGELLFMGKLEALQGGGARFGPLTVFFGSEVEIAQTKTGREAHFLAYFPDLKRLERYAADLKPYLTNPSLSTQRLRLKGDHWLEIVEEHGGVAVAAHAFTPHKGVYGNCVRKLEEMFADPRQIKALELGLSANTEMALGISDTHSYPYLANSDAHSLQNIAREFTVYDLEYPTFENWRKALASPRGGIISVHGLQPLLGKYYRSFCPRCQHLASEDQPCFHCPLCGGKMIAGVWDRTAQISDWQGLAADRPPYRSHVPLHLLPGIGPRSYGKMLSLLGTEIDILYNLSLEQIAAAAGAKIAAQIAAVRSNTLSILPGGGGKYGRVTKN